jgi:hypothetical protein
MGIRVRETGQVAGCQLPVAGEDVALPFSSFWEGNFRGWRGAKCCGGGACGVAHPFPKGTTLCGCLHCIFVTELVSAGVDDQFRMDPGAYTVRSAHPIG